jgi:hypothetical protein
VHKMEFTDRRSLLWKWPSREKVLWARLERTTLGLWQCFRTLQYSEVDGWIVWAIPFNAIIHDDIQHLMCLIKHESTALVVKHCWFWIPKLGRRGQASAGGLMRNFQWTKCDENSWMSVSSREKKIRGHVGR